MTPKNATVKQINDWQKSDLLMSGKFDVLLWFVIVPTIIQISCLVFMFSVFKLNTYLF